MANKSLRPAILASFAIKGAFLIAIVASQPIQACGLMQCPDFLGDPPACVIGDFTAHSIGATEFKTSLSSLPFTWTRINTKEGNATSNISWDRRLLLGTPPDLDLASMDNIVGCALLFDGISSGIGLPGNSLQSNMGTCQDAMGASCAADLQLQAKIFLTAISAVVHIGSSVCESLQATLQRNPPASCSFIEDGNWGEIHVAHITGPSVAETIDSLHCDLMTRRNYSLRLINSHMHKGIPRISTYGVAPILTAFVPKFWDNNTDVQSELDVALTCVKPLIAESKLDTLTGGVSAIVSSYLGMASHLLGSWMGGYIALLK